MLLSVELATLASQMQSAQDNGEQIEPFTARLSDFDLSSAYAVADIIHRARMRHGAVPVGRKIGFTNPDMWALYGVHEPIWAYVYDSTVVRLRGELQTCSLGKFTEPKIEPEIIFHFHRSPPPDGDLASILACIDWVAHGFEIVQSHFPVIIGVRSEFFRFSHSNNRKIFSNNLLESRGQALPLTLPRS